MDMFQAYGTCITKYATFDGRARRSEYWYFALCNMLISGFLSMCSGIAVGSGAVELAVVFSAMTTIYALFVFLPSLAVAVRRLHDTGHSGAHYFLILIPLVGSIIVLIYLCRDSLPGSNQYGPNPKEDSFFPAPVPTYRGPVNELPGPTLPPDRFADYPSVNAARLRVSCKSGPYAGRSVTGDVVYIGRDAHKCQLLLPNAPGVSRVHCMIQAEGRKITVRDLHSSYGTFLANGIRINPDRPFQVDNGTTLYLGSKQTAVTVSLL